jgi:hypothetical protein
MSMTKKYKACPACGYRLAVYAVKCRFCGQELDGSEGIQVWEPAHSSENITHAQNARQLQTENLPDSDPSIYPPSCSECHRLSDNLQIFSTYRVVILGCPPIILYHVDPETHEACPSCCRKNLIFSLLLNVVTANIFYPFLLVFLLPVYAVYFIRSLFRKKAHEDPEEYR